MIIPKVLSTLPFLLLAKDRSSRPFISHKIAMSSTIDVPTPEINFLSKPSTELSSSASKRYAKSIEYATEIQNHWREDVSKHPNMSYTVGFPITYSCTESNQIIDLYGYAIYPSIESHDNPNNLPAILFFHTAAGPNDIFLHWKASHLSSKLNCIVFLCDILSDPNGWCWDDDRSKYNTISTTLKTKQNGVREYLQKRIMSSINTVKNLKNVDCNNLASFGWCLGGLSIMELIQMNAHGMKALVSFHGVFPDCYNHENQNATASDNELHLLVCNGANDPFVCMKDIQALEQLFKTRSSNWTLLNYPNVKHGFTNPAQKFNENINFGYDDEAAVDSWNAALALVKRVLF